MTRLRDFNSKLPGNGDHSAPLELRLHPDINAVGRFVVEESDRRRFEEGLRAVGDGLTVLPSLDADAADPSITLEAPSVIISVPGDDKRR